MLCKGTVHADKGHDMNGGTGKEKARLGKAGKVGEGVMAFVEGSLGS